ncbi:MAG TPA: DNA replication and repair protein RecF, partial [Lysobacter sp.]
VRAGADALQVFVEWEERAGGLPRRRRAGLRHSGHAWEGRLDGEAVSQLGELCAALAVVTFEPGSHALVTGAAETRRRYLDWGLFHVEPAFLRVWRRYNRALKQRNALLKAGGGARQLDAWDHELVESGELLSGHRAGYVAALAAPLAALGEALTATVGRIDGGYAPGWRQDEMPLADALLLARERDLAAGYTSVGPHRADWKLGFSAVPGREALSRGQAKLVALAAILAQAEHFAGTLGEWPVVALDDLASELDRNHQARVLDRLVASGAQVLVSGTETPAAVAQLGLVPRRFHVEHGAVHDLGG